jgi:hypothetical protein
LSAPERIAAIVREANPFEYQGAIIRKDRFFDREAELREAMIVCKQIVRGSTGGVLAMGGRGSGKSSFLNAVQRELQAVGIPSAKISLSEDMMEAEKEPRLFKLMLNDLTSAAEEANVLDKKIGSKIRQVLQGVIESLDSLEFEAHGFGLVAKAAQQEKLAELPYAILRDGLKDFLKVLKPLENGEGRGALLIIDEGDALTKNRPLLQVLRNVFQETPGMGLVVAGTSRLLSEVSQVFSPIPRFFRKIELGPFPSDSDVKNAISSMIEHVKRELLAKQIRLDVKMYEFIDRVTELSGRAPLEFNMLSYFTFDLGASRLGWRNGAPTLYLRLGKEELEKAIQQLRGTKEYASFLDALSTYERTILVLLSKCPYGASADELTALLALDGMGENLRLASIDQVLAQLDLLKERKQQVQESIERICDLGDKYSVRALHVQMADKAVFSLEDQWVKTYFRYSVLPTLVDLELGLIAGESGILIFGDPVSSILDSAFLHTVMKGLAEGETFRVNSYPNDGLALSSHFGKVVNASFKRVADGRQWHLAFNLKIKYETDTLKADISKALAKLQDLQLISRFDVKERIRHRGWL